MRIRTFRSGLTALLACALLAAAPVEPGTITAELRPDLYFRSAQAEEADRQTVFAQADALVAKPLDTTATASQVLEALREFDDVLRHMYTHLAYLKLRSSENIEDAVIVSARRETNAHLSAVDSSTRKKIAAIDPRFAQLEREEPRLRPYAHFVHAAAVAISHDIPVALPSVAGVAGAPSPLDQYRRIIASAQYAKVSSAQGDLDPRSSAAKANGDPLVRRAAFEALARGRASIEQPLADVLMALVRTRDDRARARAYADAPSEKYFELGLTDTQVHDVLDATVRRADANKGYEKVLASITSRRLGIVDAHSYDIPLPPAGFTPPQFALDEARRILPLALRPLGAEYVREYSSLLDPRNGRLDLSGGSKRDDDGYSQGFPGTISSLYLSPYKGTLADLIALIHEGGHATHRQLMNRHGVIPVNAIGPNYMFEAFAIFNEFLLYDYLQETATTKEWKAYYLQQLINDVSFQVFGSAAETSLEEGIHHGVMAGTIRDAADIDALTLRIVGQYSIWPAIEPEREHVWVEESLFWRDPLYSVNYLYAGVLASEFYRAKERDPSHFAKRYVAMLANGFTDDPEVLLRRFLGIELYSPVIVDDAAALIEEKTAALRAATDR